MIISGPIRFGWHTCQVFPLVFSRRAGRPVGVILRIMSREVESMSGTDPDFGVRERQPIECTQSVDSSDESTVDHSKYSPASTSQAEAILRAIAAKYRGANITDRVVAQDLVAAMLRKSWQDLDLGDRASHDLNCQVAEMFLEDPRASERLIRLWNRVSDENSAT